MNPAPSALPEWKQYLLLGEALLDQPNTTAQCDLIQSTLKQRLQVEARVWLARPFYPLPGEAEPLLVSNTDTPDIVRRAFGDCQTCSQADEDDSCQVVAFPLTTQGSILGILEVRRPQGPCLQAEELNFLQGLAEHAALSMQISRQVKLKNWRYEQISLVSKVSNQIANVTDLNDLCRRVTRLIQQTFSYYYVAIFTLEEQGSAVRFRASAGQPRPSGLSPEITTQLGQGLIGSVAQSGQELHSPDVRSEPRYHYVDLLPETRSEVSFPLKVENRTLGVLDVQSDRLNAFHEIDLMVLRALADTIALGLEGAELYQSLEKRAEQIGAMLEISHTLVSQLDLDILLQEVVQVMQERFGYPYIHVFTVHPIRRKVIFRIGSGERSQAMLESYLAYDLDSPNGLIPAAARSGVTIIANDISQEPRYRPSPFPPDTTRAEMAIPLTFANEVLGVLDIQSEQINAFQTEDVSLIQSLAASIAVALRNANLYRTEKWRRQVADSFRDISGLISANTALDQLLHAILTELERNLPCQASAIWLVDENNGGQRLQLAAWHGVDPGRINQAMDESEGVRAWLQAALDGSQPHIREAGDPYGPLGIAMDFPLDYSSIAAPLRAGSQSLGLLTLAHQTTGRYGSEAQSMTTTFASSAAVAIQNARLFSDAQSQAWVATVLLQVAEASQAHNNPDDLLETMVRLTPLLVGVKKCAFFVWDDYQNAFLLKTSYGIDLSGLSQTVFSERDVPALAQLCATNAPLFIHDAVAELNLPAAQMPADTGTLVLMPLTAHGSLLGAFLVAHQVEPQPGVQKVFDEQTLAILQGIAHQTATALQSLSFLESRQQEGYVTAVLLQVAQAVASQNDLSDILDTIVHLMPILVGIDACIIYLWDASAEKFTPAQAFTGSHQKEALVMQQSYTPAQFDLLRKAYQEGHPYFSPLTSRELTQDTWPMLPCVVSEDVAALNSLAAGGWLMAFPLTVKGENFGVLLAQQSAGSMAFWERRLEILSGITQQVALAIQNERLNKEMVERERMEREVQLARQIQQTFLPSELPQPKGWDLDARWQTARTVGGDFYDIIQLDRSHLALVIADVSDKGMPAALYMTVTRTLIRANSQSILSPAAMLEQINRLLLADDAQNGMFVTAAYIIVNLENGDVVYANAGHNRPILLHHDSGEIEVLPKGGMALAVMEENHLVNYEHHMAPGDGLLLYTDGVTETFSPNGEAFDTERLQTVIQDCTGQPARALLDRVDQVLREFRENDSLTDDLTMVAVRRLPAAVSHRAKDRAAQSAHSNHSPESAGRRAGGE